MKEDEFNALTKERVDLILKHIKSLNKIRSFNGIEKTEKILNKIIDDDIEFRTKYKLYDDKIRVKIDDTIDQLRKLDSTKNVKKLPQKTAEYWRIIKEFKDFLNKLYHALAFKIGLEEFLLEKPRG